MSSPRLKLRAQGAVFQCSMSSSNTTKLSGRPGQIDRYCPYHPAIVLIKNYFIMNVQTCLTRAKFEMVFFAHNGFRLVNLNCLGLALTRT